MSFTTVMVQGWNGLCFSICADETGQRDGSYLEGLSQSAPLDTRPCSTRRWNSYFREAWDSGSSEMEKKFDHMKYTYTCSQEPLYADDLMSMIFKYHFCDLLFNVIDQDYSNLLCLPVFVSVVLENKGHA